MQLFARTHASTHASPRQWLATGSACSKQCTGEAVSTTHRPAQTVLRYDDEWPQSTSRIPKRRCLISLISFSRSISAEKLFIIIGQPPVLPQRTAAVAAPIYLSHALLDGLTWPTRHRGRLVAAGDIRRVRLIGESLRAPAKRAQSVSRRSEVRREVMPDDQRYAQKCKEFVLTRTDEGRSVV